MQDYVESLDSVTRSILTFLTRCMQGDEFVGRSFKESLELEHGFPNTENTIGFSKGGVVSLFPSSNSSLQISPTKLTIKTDTIKPHHQIQHQPTDLTITSPSFAMAHYSTVHPDHWRGSGRTKSLRSRAKSIHPRSRLRSVPSACVWHLGLLAKVAEALLRHIGRERLYCRTLLLRSGGLSRVLGIA